MKRTKVHIFGIQLFQTLEFIPLGSLAFVILEKLIKDNSNTLVVAFFVSPTMCKLPKKLLCQRRLDRHLSAINNGQRNFISANFYWGKNSSFKTSESFLNWQLLYARIFNLHVISTFLKKIIGLLFSVLV